MSDSSVKIVVPWHNPEQLKQFMEAWKVDITDPRFVFEQDKSKSGCAATKNRGIATALWDSPVATIIVLDDDCFPFGPTPSVDNLIESHLAALEPQDVEMYYVVTDPPSRGTPYHNRTIRMPVACSMGFWRGIGDYDAPGQLVHGAAARMEFHKSPIYGRYFAMSGMNIAFRPADWMPWCQFIDVPRFDDIWFGFLIQKEAYRRGYCFNLSGPIITHARQSNVWQNLRDEAKYLEQNETLWSKIATSPETDYNELIKLLPCNT